MQSYDEVFFSWRKDLGEKIQHAFSLLDLPEILVAFVKFLNSREDS